MKEIIQKLIMDNASEEKLKIKIIFFSQYFHFQTYSY